MKLSLKNNLIKGSTPVVLSQQLDRCKSKAVHISNTFDKNDEQITCWVLMFSRVSIFWHCAGLN